MLRDTNAILIPRVHSPNRPEKEDQSTRETVMRNAVLAFRSFVTVAMSIFYAHILVPKFNSDHITANLRVEISSGARSTKIEGAGRATDRGGEGET